MISRCEAVGKAKNLLFITFSVCRAGIQSPQATTLATDYFIRNFVVSFECRSELFLLLFDVIEGLVNVILFALCGQNGCVECTELQYKHQSLVD